MPIDPPIRPTPTIATLLIRLLAAMAGCGQRILGLGKPHILTNRLVIVGNPRYRFGIWELGFGGFEGQAAKPSRPIIRSAYSLFGIAADRIAAFSLVRGERANSKFRICLADGVPRRV